MEKSDLAGNAVTFLHDEGYMAAFDTPLFTHDRMVLPGGRPRIDLSGDWRFAIDPFDTGFRQRLFAMPEIAPEERTAPYDWDPFDGDTVPVPSCWNLIRPEWFLYEGGAWYARHVDDPRSGADQRVVLRVGAANYCARVFLDGVFLGRHLGGSTPFFVDLSDRMRGGRHHLLIHVENTRRPDRVPCHHTDWFNYGGLHRDVSLMVLPRDHITDLFARLVPGQGVVVDVRVSDDRSDHVGLRIPSLSIDAQVEVFGGQGRAVFEQEPELWSPDNPVLHDIEARLRDDVVRERVGFRTLAVDGSEILLNGAPLRLKGISVHEDDRDGGRVTSVADIERRFRHAKELGCNFLRLAHYPHHEWVAELADRHGLLLWAEVPVYWAVDYVDPGTRADALNQLSELVRRDRNRASVLTWSIANETPDTDERLAFLTALADRARQLDGTRPLSAACLFNQESRKIEDRLAALVDIVGINEYFGWYDPDYADLEAILANYDLDKPLVISEMGADGIAGFRGSPGRIFTEEHMAAIYERQLEILGRSAAVKGISPWLLYDFRTERRQNPYQRGWNRKGLMADDKRTRKLAFDRLAAFYHSNWGV